MTPLDGFGFWQLIPLLRDLFGIERKRRVTQPPDGTRVESKQKHTHANVVELD